MFLKIAILLLLTHLGAFYAGAKYGMMKLRLVAAELMKDMDKQLEHLGSRITEEVNEKLRISVAWMRHKFGLK